jgi:hypothetical protein
MDKLISKLKHPGWGAAMALIAAFGSTLAPPLMRVVCLGLAVVVATWTLYRTEFAGRKILVTIPAFLLFSLLALAAFHIAGKFDPKPEQTKDVPQPQQTIPPAQATASAPEVTKPSVKKKSSHKQVAAKDPLANCPQGTIGIVINGGPNSSIHNNLVQGAGTGVCTNGSANTEIHNNAFTTQPPKGKQWIRRNLQ